MAQTLEQYKEHVEKRLQLVSEILPSIAVGDFSKRLVIPSEEDEFSRLYMGINCMLGDLHEQLRERKRLDEALRESEERYRKLIELSFDGIAIHSGGKAVLVNSAGAQLLGAAKSDQILGKPITDFVHPDNREIVAERLQQVQEEGKPAALFEEKFLRLDGTVIDVEVLGIPITYQDQPAVQVVFRDITKRKKAEQAVQRSSQQWKSTFNAISDSICLTDMDGKILLCNQATTKLLGKPCEEIVGKHCWELMHSTSAHIEGCPALQMQKTRKRESTELSFRGRILKVVVDPVFDDSGNIVGVVHVVTDVTERNLVEEREKQYTQDLEYLSETAMSFVELPPDADIYRYIAEHLKKLVGNSIVIVNSFDPDTDLTQVRSIVGMGKLSKSVLKILGKDPMGTTYKINEVARRHLLTGKYHKIPGKMYELSFGQIPKPICRALEKLIGITEIHSLGFTWEGQLLGTVVIIRRENTDLENKNAIETFINQAAVALQRKQAEETLREREARYRKLVELSPEPIAVHSEGKIVFINNAVVKLLGASKPEQLIGKPIMDFLHPDYHEVVKERIRHINEESKEAPLIEEKFIRLDGSIIDVEVSAIPFTYKGMSAVQVVVRDITERKQREEEMKMRLMRFRVEEGNLYMVKEPIPSMSLEVFKDLLKVGHKGVVISRTPKKKLKKAVEDYFEFFLLAEKGEKEHLPPKLIEIELKIENLPRKSALLIDRLDYLILKNGFEKTLFFVQRLRELANLADLIVIISIDPSTLGDRELRLLEKEAMEVEPIHKARVPESLLEVLSFVYKQNTVGVKPSYTIIGSELEMSKPTVRKRIRSLINSGYVIEVAKGRTKIVEITEKGRSLFLG